MRDAGRRFSNAFPFAFPFAFPLLLTAAVYAYTAGGRAFLDGDEARYVQVALQMAERGDWLTPYANGLRYFNKPPLLYWLEGASFGLFGVTEFAARLPVVLGLLGTTWLVQRLAALAAGGFAGLVAGLSFAFCIGTFLFTREVMHDMLVVFFLTLSMYCLALWYRDHGEGAWPVIGFGASLAGAVLSKGLIGIAFPAGIALVVYVLWKPRPAPRPIPLLLGGLCFLALALPWHLAVEFRSPGFLEHYFVNEQILRFFEKREPVDYTSVPLPIFWALLLLWFFPWSAFLPAAVSVRGGSNSATPLAGPIVRIAACWFGLVLLFFSISQRLEHYAFPLLPPMAILVGLAFRAEPDERTRRLLARGYGFLAILGAVVLVAGLLGLVWWQGLDAASPGDYPGYTRSYDNDFGPLFDLPAEARGQLFGWPVVVMIFAVAGGFLAAWRLHTRGRRYGAIACLAAVMTVFSLLAHHSLGVLENVISSRVFGEAIAEIYAPGDQVVVIGDFETANSINVYAPVRLLVYQGRAVSLWGGTQYPDAPPMILSPPEFAELWRSPQRAFALVPESKRADLGIDPAVEVLHSGGRVLLSNRPVRPPVGGVVPN